MGRAVYAFAGAGSEYPAGQTLFLLAGQGADLFGHVRRMLGSLELPMYIDPSTSSGEGRG